MSTRLRTSICAFQPCGQAYDPGANVSGALELIRQAAKQGADLAVLPETGLTANAPDWMQEAQPLDGEVVSAFAAEAARLGIWVVINHPTLEGGARFNSSVMLDRGGNIAAVYHKVHPTIWELQGGIVPGEGPVVVDTEFGRVGFAICYDINFAELRLAYRDLRPNLVVFCSAFRAGLQAQWWAYETRSYLVSSVLDPRSMFINPVGRVLGGTDSWTRTATATLELDYAVVHYDYTNRSLADALDARGSEFDFEWSEPEGVMLITSRGERRVSELVQEMGWEVAEDYFARARSAQARTAAGETIEPGLPGW